MGITDLKNCPKCKNEFQQDHKTMGFVCVNQGCVDYMKVHKFDFAFLGADYGSEQQPEKQSDERTMAEGIAQDLKKAFINIIDFGYKSDQAPIVDIITTLIDARIELHAVQMKPIIELGHTAESFNDDIEKICRAKSSHYKRLFEGAEATFNSIRANNGLPMISESIADALDKNLEPLPAFIPLTENNPTEIRNGDRFNINGKTCQVRFEKKYIPGLREIEVKPFAGYEPVKPGNPYDELNGEKKDAI